MIIFNIQSKPKLRIKTQKLRAAREILERQKCPIRGISSKSHLIKVLTDFAVIELPPGGDCINQIPQPPILPLNYCHHKISEVKDMF